MRIVITEQTVNDAIEEIAIKAAVIEAMEKMGNLEEASKNKKVGPYPTFGACEIAQENKGYSKDSATKICGTIVKNMRQAQEAESSKYINADKTFKGGFEGCKEYQMHDKGLPAENAEKLCAYIGRKAGKI